MARLHRSHNENLHTHFLCVHTVWLQHIHVSMNTPCLHLQISIILLPGYAPIFQQYLSHTYVYIHIRWDVRETLNDIFLSVNLSVACLYFKALTAIKVLNNLKHNPLNSKKGFFCSVLISSVDTHCGQSLQCNN